ncbi:hypothetical protein [Fretibacter rubidus]|uniref:FliH/SctL family protein n=1 Tax=Fretibacter rubidus TaxID=570162 RepID=UPI00352ACE3E
MPSILKQGKSSNGETVKPLKFGIGPGEGGQTAKDRPLQAASKESVKIIALQAEVEKLKLDITQFKIEAEQAVSAAREGGRNEATQAFEKKYEKANEALGRGIDKGLEKLDDRLSSLDGLALLISQTVLEKFFCPNQDYKETITRMIRKQLEAIRRETVMHVRVSSDDFDTDESLEDLAVALDLRYTDIKIGETVRPGDCVIDLRLGHVELSLKNQWDTIQTLFKDMANDEGEI